MPTTLLGFVHTIPAFQGRVYLTQSPGSTGAGPPVPNAIVFKLPGSTVQAYYGHADVVSAYHCVTVYDHPLVNDGAGRADSYQRVLALIAAIDGALDVVDTDVDGVTPLVRGSFQRANPPPVPLDDPDTKGGYYATCRFSALTKRG